MKKNDTHSAYSILQAAMNYNSSAFWCEDADSAIEYLQYAMDSINDGLQDSEDLESPIDSPSLDMDLHY